MGFRYIVFGVIGLWLFVPALTIAVLPTGTSTDWAIRGQFGDLFGSVNALFSGLAFVGLIWALKLQRDQLELQRTELGLQREELGLQRQEMAASRKELAKQVMAQEALFRASAAQIAVASAQARIEAIRFESLGMVEGGRTRYVGQVKAIADELTSLYQEVSATEGQG